MATAAVSQVAGIPASRPLDNKWLVAASISFGAIMATIDLSIINVALPQIRGSIGASLDEITAIATSYAIAQVVVMPLTAFLGRFFGQKRVYLICLGLFLIGSALCGMARSLSTLVMARIFQGFGAGALQPSQQAILRQTFPPREQGMAMAMVGMAVMIGPALGPTLGGWIVDNYSWPWIFFINLPIGVVGMLMVSRFVHEPADIRAANHASAERMRKNMDWAGIALMSVGLATLQYVLQEGNRNDWFQSREIFISTVLAVTSIVGFVIIELRAPAPAVLLRLFKDAIFSSSTIIGGVMFAVMMASMFLLPVFMQELLGYTAFQSGLTLVPRTLVMMAMNPIVGRIYNHVSPRVIIALGVILVAFGTLQMGAFTLATSTAGIISAQILQGIGFSCLFVPLVTLSLSHVPRPQLTDASGLNAVVRQFGGSAGLAIFANLLTTFAIQARGGLMAHVDMSRPEVTQRLGLITRGLMQRGMDPVSARVGAVQALNGMVMRQAQVIAFEKTFILCGVLMLMLLPLTVFLKHRPHLEPSEVSHGET